MISKIPQGGWFPLVVAGAVFVPMTRWKRGRYILADRLEDLIVPISDFMEKIDEEPPERIPGTAVFMDSRPEGTPPELLRRLEPDGESVDPDEATYFLGRETLIATDESGMAGWRERLFALMSRNAERAPRYFHIPSEQVVELGTQVDL